MDPQTLIARRRPKELREGMLVLNLHIKCGAGHQYVPAQLRFFSSRRTGS